MTQSETKKAALYLRVSTNEQSNERQRADLTAFAQRAGYEIVATFEEKASGAKTDRKQRAKVIELARLRKIDAILVTELTRWSRSTQDLLASLQQLASWNVSMVAQTGLDFDLNTPQGKLFGTIMAGLVEFERDIIRERVKSGLENAKAKGKKLGRQIGQNPSDKYAKTVIKHLDAGRSVRWIAHEMQISTTTIQAIKRRHTAA
jgi:putative DNA-invertase from lambdoid prophage Rac